MNGSNVRIQSSVKMADLEVDGKLIRSENSALDPLAVISPHLGFSVGQAVNIRAAQMDLSALNHVQIPVGSHLEITSGGGDHILMSTSGGVLGIVSDYFGGVTFHGRQG